MSSLGLYTCEHGYMHSIHMYTPHIYNTHVSNIKQTKQPATPVQLPTQLSAFLYLPSRDFSSPAFQEK